MILEKDQPGMIYSDYKYIFVPFTRIVRCRHWEVRDFEGSLLGEVVEDILSGPPMFSPNCSDVEDEDVLNQFDIFKNNCPAYYVHPVRMFEVMEDMDYEDKYFTLFLGSLVYRQWCSTRKVERSREMKICERFFMMRSWLTTTDFLYAPASSRYHDSEHKGLLKHTIKVVEKLSELFQCYSFQRYSSSSCSFASAVLVALVHDWCKINYYEAYNRNVKNDKTGQWEKVESYKIKDVIGTCLGHGVSSMFIANKFFNLTRAEAEAIRWHMGEYNVAPNEMNELHQANAYNPLCYLIQFADRLACTKY